MAMTFIRHPLSYYNSITEPRAQFLLSLLEDIPIDFPSHFILSLIDVYRDTATCDKLIFPSVITRILHHFSMIGAIDVATVRRSEAQLRLRRPQTQTTAPLASTAPSTSTPSSFTSGVTFEAIMTQLVRMDAHLDTFSDELCLVNNCIGRITR